MSETPFNRAIAKMEALCDQLIAENRHLRQSNADLLAAAKQAETLIKSLVAQEPAEWTDLELERACLATLESAIAKAEEPAP